MDAPSGPSGPHSSLLDPILPVPPVPPIPTPPDRSCDLPGSPQIAQVAQSQDAHTVGAGPEPGPGGPLHPFAFARSCVRDGCGGCVTGTSGLHPSLHLHSTSLVGITSRPAGLALPDSPDSPRPHLSLTASPTAALTSACCSLPVSPSSTSAVLPRLSTAVPTSASCTLPSSPSPASAVLPSLTTPADPSASSSLLLGSPAPLASQSQPSAPLSGSPSPAASHRSSFDASFSPDLPSSSQATDQPSSWPSDPMTPPSSHPSLPSTDPDYTGPTPTSSPSRQSPSPVDSPSRLPIDPDDPHAPEPLAPESLESTPLSQGRPSRPPLRPAAEEARSRFQPAALRTRVRPVPGAQSTSPPSQRPRSDPAAASDGIPPPAPDAPSPEWHSLLQLLPRLTPSAARFSGTGDGFLSEPAGIAVTLRSGWGSSSCSYSSFPPPWASSSDVSWLSTPLVLAAADHPVGSRILARRSLCRRPACEGGLGVGIPESLFGLSPSPSHDSASRSTPSLPVCHPRPSVLPSLAS